MAQVQQVAQQVTVRMKVDVWSVCQKPQRAFHHSGTTGQAFDSAPSEVVGHLAAIAGSTARCTLLSRITHGAMMRVATLESGIPMARAQLGSAQNFDATGMRSLGAKLRHAQGDAYS